MKSAHTEDDGTGLSKKTGMILVVLFIMVLGTGAGYFLVNQIQNPQKRAQEIQTGPTCPLNGFICRWNRQPGVSYHFIIKDDAGALIKEGDIPASSSTDKITITHTPESGKTYTCHVEATNECGSVEVEKSADCSSVSQPTVAVESATPTLIAETPTEPVAEPTMTATPTIRPSITTTPKAAALTDIIIANVTNTPMLSSTASSKAPTKQPTLPATGLSSLPMLTIFFVGFIIITLGFVL